MRGNLVVFLELQATFGVSLELCQGAQGASHVAPGKSSLHSTCEGERGIVLESWQGNWASRCVEGGKSRSFSSCGRKPWVPSNCDGDLRELLMVPMGSQIYCGVWRGLLGLYWVWCNGRGLEVRPSSVAPDPAESRGAPPPPHDPSPLRGTLEKRMAIHSSILAWRIPWTEEPGGLQSTGSQS